MSNTVRTTATTRVPMDSTRKTALVAGIFYLIITVPLTHLVNVIDRRLRDGRPLGRPRRRATARAHRTQA